MTPPELTHYRTARQDYAELCTPATLRFPLFADYIGLYVLCGLSLVAVHLIVLLEERQLGDRFGNEYVEYMNRVPRFIPRRGSSS